MPNETSEPPDSKTPTPEARSWQRLAPVGVLGGIAVALPPLGGFALLGAMPWVGPWLEAHQAPGVALYVVGFVLLAGFALLPTYAQAVLAGFAFGVPVGVPAALCGFTGAAAVGYAVARRVAGDRLAEAADTEPRLAALHHALLQGGFWRVLGVVTLLRLPPNSPFALTNVAFAGLKVPFPTFVLGTLLGMSPRTILAVVIGAGLESFDTENFSNNTIFFVGLGVTVAVVVIITIMARRVLDRITPPETGENPTMPEEKPTD
ncbi:MAG: VTT domain-containing protein [Planctomycetota bacterium]